VSESRIMTQPAASAHPLDDDAIGAALVRIGAIGAGAAGRCRVASPPTSD
jgi:hypothetical protein